MSDLVLRPLTHDDEAAAQEAASDFAGDHDPDFFLLGYTPGMPWAQYVADRERHTRGEGLRPGWVPADFLVAVEGGVFVGRVSLRHELGHFLDEAGGHIGYGVRASYRRRGYATRMLALALDRARGLGLSRVLLTCDDDNVASARVIERNGGVFERMVDPARIHPDSPLQESAHIPMRRYWITL